MKIAMTSKGTAWNSLIDPRFGRTEFLGLFDEGNNTITFNDNMEDAEAAHGAGTKMATELIESGAEILITGNGPGSNAKMALEQAQIKIFTGAEGMNLEEALRAYHDNKLTTF